VIFPQFAAEGPLPRHGFARTTRWTLARAVQSDDAAASAIFTLGDTDHTRAVWPVSFAATLVVVVRGATLAVHLAVENTHHGPITFTAALHTYLRVADIAAISLAGLQGIRYRESRAPGVLTVDDAPLLRPEGEVDRVYVNVPHALLLRDGERALEISATGFPDVVVWNPGSVKAAALADMEPGGDARMLCVEAAAVQQPVTLAPGQCWRGEQQLRALPGAD
jgi:glucose-6-phosphate 1-epimerase